jgi:hypothetical protein
LYSGQYLVADQKLFSFSSKGLVQFAPPAISRVVSFRDVSSVTRLGLFEGLSSIRHARSLLKTGYSITRSRWFLRHAFISAISQPRLEVLRALGRKRLSSLCRSESRLNLSRVATRNINRVARAQHSISQYSSRAPHPPVVDLPPLTAQYRIAQPFQSRSSSEF